MTRPTQKKSERDRVQGLLRCLGLEGTVDDGEDPPDCLARFFCRTIAVEVTEFHYPNPRRQVEEAWREIKFEANGRRERCPYLNNLSVLLVFKELKVPGRREKVPFVNSIIHMIKEHLHDVSLTDFLHIPIPDSSPEIIRRYLKKIILRRADCWIDWSWNYDVDLLPSLEVSVEMAVKKKSSQKKPDSCDEFWLVVTGGIQLSQFMAINDLADLKGMDSCNHVIEESSFDKVFLIDSEVFRWDRTAGWQQVTCL